MSGEKKKSFLLYLDNRILFDAQSDVAAGKLIKAIYRYACDGKVLETDDKMLGLAFSVIRNCLDRDAVKYAERCEKRRQAALERYEKAAKEAAEKEAAEKAARAKEAAAQAAFSVSPSGWDARKADMMQRVRDGSALGFND